MIGTAITTVGISLLTLGLVGASIEVQRQWLTASVQQQVSALAQRLPEFIRPEGLGAGGEQPASGSVQILLSLVGNLAGSPLWLAIVVVGIAMIFAGLYITQRQRAGR